MRIGREPEVNEELWLMIPRHQEQMAHARVHDRVHMGSDELNRGGGLHGTVRARQGSRRKFATPCLIRSARSAGVSCIKTQYKGARHGAVRDKPELDDDSLLPYVWQVARTLRTTPPRMSGLMTGISYGCCGPRLVDT